MVELPWTLTWASRVDKHSARYFLVESAEGVGSRFRASSFPFGWLLAENDFRPGVFEFCLSRPMSLIPFLFCVERPSRRVESLWSAVD